jgi:hypothetical protein
MTKVLVLVSFASVALGALSLTASAVSSDAPAAFIDDDAQLAAANEQPEEHGRVRWRTNYDDARREAAKRGLPLLVLFNEVPGCSTVRGYANRVLTHPLIVEAVETLFVPVLVRNNVGGREREVLEQWREPTWNNPVMRILDADERMLAPRLSGDTSPRGTVSTMTTALSKAGRPVPTWLALLQEEIDGARHAKTATVGMSCFWSGEVGLADAPGVLATQPGFLDGREVVEVTYDSRRATYAEVVRHALTTKAANQIAATDATQAREGSDVGDTWRAEGRFRYSPKDDKYQLSRSPLRLVPMTALQAAKVNAAVGRGRDPSALLSPRQNALWHAIANAPNKRWPEHRSGQSLAEAWTATAAVVAR